MVWDEVVQNISGPRRVFRGAPQQVSICPTDADSRVSYHLSGEDRGIHGFPFRPMESQSLDGRLYCAFGESRSEVWRSSQRVTSGPLCIERFHGASSCPENGL